MSRSSAGFATSDGRILVASEDAIESEAIAGALREDGYPIIACTSERDLLDRLAEADPVAVLVSDVHLGALSGVEILRHARARSPDIAVVLAAEAPDVLACVELLQEGALAYLPKPINMRELRAHVRNAIAKTRSEREVGELRRRLDDRFGFERIIGHHPSIQKLVERLRAVADTPATALILGENGTGKELVASCIHQNSSRRQGKFVALNCAAISESLLESELFGHERGAFTGAVAARRGKFEEASGGTLFLDEVGDMPLTTQIKLLRVLETREITRVGSNDPIKIDIRLIAATNQDLEALVREKRFREDLYYRLRVVTIQIAPLRERPSDIPLLVDAFIRELAEKSARPVTDITEEARRVLQKQRWSGNVRELRNAVEQMVVLARQPVLDLDDIPEEYRQAGREGLTLTGLAGYSREDVEREHVRQTLELTSGNREEAAKLLKIGERTLYREIKKYVLK